MPRAPGRSSEIRPFATGHPPPPSVIPLVPEPADLRLVRCDVPGVEHLSGLYRVWLDGDGGRCRRCRPATCTLKEVPGSPGIATCVVIVEGEALPGLPADWTIRG